MDRRSHRPPREPRPPDTRVQPTRHSRYLMSCCIRCSSVVPECGTRKAASGTLGWSTPIQLPGIRRRPTSSSAGEFLDLYPGAAQDGLLAACRRVLRTGEPADLPGHPWAVTVRGRSIVAPTHLRITRYRDGVLVTWIPGRPTRLPKTDRGWVRHDR